MGVRLGALLVAPLVAACIVDHFPAIAVQVQNVGDDPVIVVVAANNVNTFSTPRPEVRAYLVEPGATGWTHLVLIHGETGWLSAYSMSCEVLGRDPLTDGVYSAIVGPGAALEVKAIERGASAGKPAMQTFGDSCGFGAGLLALPPGPVPTDGLEPSGDPADQAIAALRTVGLDVAPGVVLNVPRTVRWLPNFTVIEAVSVLNGSNETIVIPNELTVLQWDGDEWVRERCTYEQDIVVPKQVCKGKNDSEVAAGSEDSGSHDDLFFDWPGREADPGTYALVVPVRGSRNDAPSTGAIAIVTVTANP